MAMLLEIAVSGFWLERKRDVSHNTFLEYSHWFRSFLDFTDAETIEAVTPAHVRAWLNDLAESGELSDKSISNAWVALSAFFTWAAAELGIPHPLRGRVRRPSYKPKPIVPYTHAEVAAMLRELDKGPEWTTRTGKTARSRRPSALRDKAIILVLLDTGVRASELCNLSYDDFDQGSGRLLVREGKGAKDRHVYLGESARRVLWRYMNGRTGGPLFPTRNNTPLNRSNLSRLIRRIAKAANVKKANVHRFRHTFAVNFLRNGGNVFALQNLLGHARMDTVKTYVRLAEQDLADAQRRASPVDNWRL